MSERGEQELAELRKHIHEMARKAEDSGDPLAWFEDLYRISEGDDTMIPWSDGHPHPFLVEWNEQKASRGRALVVGCGLGEDAAYLARTGWEVTAFDLSSTAVEWASKIHQEPNIEWKAEDLLNLPEGWKGAWDLVLEVHILQAIPPEIRQVAATRLAPLVAPNGNLVCIGRINLTGEELDGPPWPLERQFIEEIGSQLNQTEFLIQNLPNDEPEVNRYLAVWNSD